MQVLESAPFAYSSLLQECTTHRERAALHTLGFALGIVHWQQDWRHSMLSIPQQAQHAPASLTASPAMQQSTADDKDAAQTPHGLAAVVHQLLGRDQLATGQSLSATSTPQAGTSLLQAGITTLEAASPAAVVPRSAAQCRQIVEAVQRDDFGIGLQLTGEAAELRRRQNERMGRALQRLSQELYSKVSQH